MEANSRFRSEINRTQWTCETLAYSSIFQHVHSVLSFTETTRPLSVEFYLYPTVGTVLIHSVKPELTE